MDYTQFTKAVSESYLEKFKAMFVARYSFDGDELFDKRAQQLFFKSIFTEGNVAVVRTLDARVVMRYYPKANEESKQSAIGINGRVNSAIIYPAWKNFRTIGGFGYAVKNNLIENPMFRTQDNKTIVFYQQFSGDEYISQTPLASKMKMFLEQLSQKHLKAKLYNAIAGGQLIASTDADSQTQIKNLFSIDKVASFAPSYDRQNDEHDITKTVEAKLQVLDYGKLDPNIFLDSILKYEQIICKMFGFRVNPVFKKARINMEEMNDSQTEFKALEKVYRNSLQIFMKDYKAKFGIELQLIDHIAADENNEAEAEAKQEGESNDE